MTMWVASVLATLAGAVENVKVAPHHRHHRRRPELPMAEAVASWYDYAGSTASGIRYEYGFASLMFGSRWGTRVLFCHAGHCVVGQLDDHGPYITGRSFDLWPSLRDALHCPDLCTVAYRVLRPRLEWRLVPAKRPRDV